MFDKILKSKFARLTDKVNHDHLTYYFEGDTAKNFDDFNNGIVLLKIKQPCEIKLEEVKKNSTI